MIDRDIARGGCTHQRDVIYAFKFLLCLRVITSVAIWMDFALLFTLLSYEWRAAPFEVGVTAALYGFPGLVLGPWLRARADRAHPLKLLRRSYWARAIASIGLITAPSLLVFMAFVTCQGLANLVVMPSEQVLIKRTLNTAWMIRHTRYTTAADQAAKITAPLISASLAHGFGARLGYLPPRQNSCRPDRTFELGTMMEARNGQVHIPAQRGRYMPTSRWPGYADP